MAILFAVAALAMNSQPVPISVIPQPVTVQVHQGSFTITGSTAIAALGMLSEVAQGLRRCLAPATGYDFPPVNRAGANTIELKLDNKATKLGPEGYVLDIKSDRVTIRAFQPAGIFYGCQTLKQLLPVDIFRTARVPIAWTLPTVHIEDQPRFGWRGAHIDVSRHFMPKEFILKFLDLMALHKLNVFHWHLTDDCGWRFEIKQYPRLTKAGSVTDYSEMNPTGATRSINQRPGGFYTQEDVREIVRYAADRFITVLPEIELPGHSNSAILAYPEFGNKQQLAAAGVDTKFLGTYDNVFNVDDDTIKFLKNVLDEVMELFPSRFIHIGGDEVWKEPWKKNPKAQERMKALGLKNEEELQSWFIKQFDTYLVSKGRRLIGWDEILEGGLAPGAAVMSWRGIDGGIAAAKAGHDVVMAPNSHTYFDHYQSKMQSQEPKAIGGFLPLQKVYEFEPIPPALTVEEGKHVLGGQAQLWTEFIPHPKHMEYMAFPRLCALSEAVWSSKTSRSWKDFSARLGTHLDRLRVLDVNFRPIGMDPKPAAQWRSGETTEAFAVKEWDVSPAFRRAGDYDVLFSFTSGEHRLDIEWVEVVVDGKPTPRDTHPGRTGGDNKGNNYRVKVGTGSKFVLRASVRSDGGADSNGDIYVLKPG
jgi:hexosaminidase